MSSTLHNLESHHLSTVQSFPHHRFVQFIRKLLTSLFPSLALYLICLWITLEPKIIFKRSVSHFNAGVIATWSCCRESLESFKKKLKFSEKTFKISSRFVVSHDSDMWQRKISPIQAFFVVSEIKSLTIQLCNGLKSFKPFHLTFADQSWLYWWVVVAVVDVVRHQSRLCFKVSKRYVATGDYTLKKATRYWP